MMTKAIAKIRYMVYFKPRKFGSEWISKNPIEIKGNPQYTAEENFERVVDSWQNDRVVVIDGNAYEVGTIESIEKVVDDPIEKEDEIPYFLNITPESPSVIKKRQKRLAEIRKNLNSKLAIMQ